MSKALNSEVVALNAMFHARMQQRGIERDQNKFLEKIQRQIEETADMDQTLAGHKVADLIAQDKRMLGVFNQAITESGKEHLAIKVNKLAVVLNNGLPKLLADEHVISSILSGKLPAGIDNSIGDTVPVLGSGEYYGGGNPLYVSALLHYAALALELDSNSMIGANSAIYHRSPLSEKFPQIEGDLSWYNKTTNDLVVPHGGYAWGGHRNQKTENPFAPEDCASFLERHTTPQIVTTTADLMCTWNVTTDQFNGWKPDQWGSEKLTELYSPVELKDVRAGDIYFHKLLKGSPKDTVYASGHAAIAFSVGNQEVKTIGANRDLEREFSQDPKPGMEGIGLQSFPLQVEGKFIGFLRPTDLLTNQLPNSFGINGMDWGHEPITEQNIVQYYDSHYGVDGIALAGAVEAFAAAGGHD